MPTLEDHITIRRDATTLFDLSQDYPKRLNWDKYLRKAVLLHQGSPALNSEAYCQSRKGPGMTVRYISFNRPSQTAMEMVKGPFIFRKFSGSWRFIPLSPDETRVVFRYHFQTIFPLLLNPFISRLLRTDLKKRLASLKAYAEQQTAPFNQASAY